MTNLIGSSSTVHMRNFLQKLIIFGTLFSTIELQANTETCDKSKDVTAFSQVKDEKAFFYTQPLDKKKSKSFLITKDFIQVLGAPVGAFSCVVYRNYNGHGGKKKYGWVLTSTLHPLRVKLERKDLVASWNKSPCFDDSCVVNIAEEKGKLEIDIGSFLNDHPGQSYFVGKTQETSNRLVLTNFQGSDGAPEKIEIEFINTKEPGTILLIGPDGWSGTYHR